jgi:chaperonin GroES
MAQRADNAVQESEGPCTTACSSAVSKPKKRRLAGSSSPTPPRKSRRKAKSSPSAPAPSAEDGKVTPLDVKAGDRILFGKWSGTEVKVDGEDLLIMKESRHPRDRRLNELSSSARVRVLRNFLRLLKEPTWQPRT